MEPHLQHPCSSELSAQSASPSHLQCPIIHSPLPQRNMLPAHVRRATNVVGHPTSSELSWQSFSASHFHFVGIQFLFVQVNSVDLHVFEAVVTQ